MKRKGSALAHFDEVAVLRGARLLDDCAGLLLYPASLLLWKLFAVAVPKHTEEPLVHLRIAMRRRQLRRQPLQIRCFLPNSVIYEASARGQASESAQDTPLGSLCRAKELPVR